MSTTISPEGESGPRDEVVLPGADSWLIRKIGTILDEGMLVAAICSATMGLANAGLLDNKTPYQQRSHGTDNVLSRLQRGTMVPERAGSD